MENYCDDILDCESSAAYERSLFAGDPRAALRAMDSAGRKTARAILSEFGPALGGAPEVLALVGSGHNGGDAARAALEILEALPGASISVFAPGGFGAMKPNTAFFAGRLMSSCGRVREVGEGGFPGRCGLVLEGLAGMSFKPPMRGGMERAVALANSARARVKASVDLPAGVGDFPPSSAFRADVTYMTGIAKAAAFKPENREFVGRLRYVDLGFFPEGAPRGERAVVSGRVLEPLRLLRRAETDKRSYGHLFIFAGSSNYPGAALMNAKAALRSGVGLVSAFVPERFACQLAAAEPACIWIPCPEDESGGLSLETFSLFRGVCGAESAVLAGSGMGKSAESAALVSEIIKNTAAPVVLDADAIRPSVLDAAPRDKILITPHAGEFLRISGGLSDADLSAMCRSRGVAALLKGPFSRICDGGGIAFNVSGGPMLSRAGSGDVLAGLAAGFLARRDLGFSRFDAACAAARLLGCAAEKAFAECGETAYATSDIFPFIKKALADD